MGISHLFNKIDEFYSKISKLAQTTYVDPDENEEFQAIKQKTPQYQLEELIPHVKNEDIFYELSILSRLYPKAVELNDGFTSISRFIENLKNELEDNDIDDVESLGINIILDKILDDIRIRSKNTLGKPDGKDAISALTEIKNEYQLAEIEKETGLGEDEEDKVVFDPTAGLSKEKGDNIGNYFSNMTQYIDWSTKYNSEADHYQDILNTTIDPRTKEYLQKIITIFRKLAINNKQMKHLFVDIQNVPGSAAESEAKFTKNELLRKEIRSQLASKEFAELKAKDPVTYNRTVDDFKARDKILELQNKELKIKIQAEKELSTDETEKEYFKLKEETEKLKIDLQFYRKRVRNINYQRQIDYWKEQLTQLNSINLKTLSADKLKELDREKMILEQQIARNEILLSSDYERSPERDARASLIRVLKGIGTQGKGIRNSWLTDQRYKDLDPNQRSNVTQEEVNKLLLKIEEAKKLRVPKKTIINNEWAKIKREKIQSKSLEGLLLALGQKIASTKVIIKQKITDPIKKKIKIEQKHTLFQPYIDKINEAKNAKNEKAVIDLTKELTKAINNFGETDPSVIKFIESNLALTEARKKLSNQLSIINTSKAENLSEQDIEIINNMILQSEEAIIKWNPLRHYSYIVPPLIDLTNALKQIITPQVRVEIPEEKHKDLIRIAPIEEDETIPDTERENTTEERQMKFKARKNLLEKIVKQAQTNSSIKEAIKAAESKGGDFGNELFDILLENADFGLNKLD